VRIDWLVDIVDIDSRSAHAGSIAQQFGRRV
jgi:hypothetical protein